MALRQHILCQKLQMTAVLLKPDHAAMIDLVMAADPESRRPWRTALQRELHVVPWCRWWHPNPQSPNARQFIFSRCKMVVMISGAHPWRMYVTFNKGYNGMPAQPQFMGSEEKVYEAYALIAYLRETFFKDQNDSQYITDVDTSAGPWPVANLGGGAVELNRAALSDIEIAVPVTGAMVANAADFPVAAADAAVSQLDVVAREGTAPGSPVLAEATSWRSNGVLALGLVNAAEAGDASAFVAAAAPHADLRHLVLLDSDSLGQLLAAVAAVEL